MPFSHRNLVFSLTLHLHQQFFATWAQQEKKGEHNVDTLSAFAIEKSAIEKWIQIQHVAARAKFTQFQIL